jgi:hypothetical protein
MTDGRESQEMEQVDSYAIATFWSMQFLLVAGGTLFISKDGDDIYWFGLLEKG